MLSSLCERGAGVKGEGEFNFLLAEFELYVRLFQVLSRRKINPFPDFETEVKRSFSSKDLFFINN